MPALIAAHLWQSTLFLAAAWLLARVCRRNSAAVRYWIWFAASAKFLVPLALLQRLGDSLGRSLPEPLPVDPALIETANAILILPVAGATVSGGAPWQFTSVLAIVWAVGAAALCLRWFLQWLAVRSMVAFAPEEHMDLPAPVRITSSGLAPGVFGIFQPVILLPRAVMRELGPEQLRAVLAHEACHVRRRDNLTAAIHKCVEALFWFHPLVWWMGANLLRERESACDESVVAAGHEQGVYAQSILNVCRLGIGADSFSLASSTGGDLTQRIRCIMRKERARPVGPGHLLLLFAMLLLAGYVPFASGIAVGAIREAAESGPVVFDVITLKPSQRGWLRRTRFDAAGGTVVLKNVSLRQLILEAYPASEVNGESRILDGVRYDIEARWRTQGGTSARNVHRELLDHILWSHFNLRLHIRECEADCG